MLASFCSKHAVTQGDGVRANHAMAVSTFNIHEINFNFRTSISSNRSF
jgi:hypothetical protein